MENNNIETKHSKYETEMGRKTAEWIDLQDCSWKDVEIVTKGKSQERKWSSSIQSKKGIPLISITLKWILINRNRIADVCFVVKKPKPFITEEVNTSN